MESRVNRIDVGVDKGLKCASGDIALFHSQVPTETEADWTMAPGAAIFLWATVTHDRLRVFGFGGDGVTPADGHAVIDSMRFIQSLPTP